MESSVKEPERIDVRAAVNAVQKYFNSIQTLWEDAIENLRLEEVELSEDKQFWFITLGFDRRLKDNNPIMLEIGPQSIREYKVFKVNAQTGEVVSMKIREL